MKWNILIVVVLVVLNVMFYYVNGPAYIDDWWSARQEAVSLDGDVVEVFMFALNDEVITNSGRPPQGFTPEAYLAVLPGLVPTDFDQVDAQLGHYAVINGQLVHIKAGDRLQHQFAKVVTLEGMEDLLQNVVARTGLQLGSEHTITDVINVVVNEQAPL